MINPDPKLPLDLVAFVAHAFDEKDMKTYENLFIDQWVPESSSSIVDLPS